MTRRDVQRQRSDRKRREEKPWRKWYSLKVWKIRRRRQLEKEPFCASCLEHGRHRLATVANHVEPHRGDWFKFIKGKLESLCKTCHDARAQRTDNRGFDPSPGADGWPTDPKHPANRPRYDTPEKK